VYKNSNQRTQDYLAKFDQHDILRNLVETSTPVILDVGANIGQSIDKLKGIWPEAELHCFEPLPEQYKELEYNARLYDNTYTYNVALGDVNNPKKFYVNKHQNMLSGFYNLNPTSKDSIALNQPETAHDNFLDNETITVDCVTLDKWAHYHKIDYVDIIKMDTQGSEPEILTGAVQTLARTNVVITELMFYDLYTKKNSFYDIESVLLPLGFELFDIGYISKNPMTGRTDWVDVIYRKL